MTAYNEDNAIQVTKRSHEMKGKRLEKESLLSIE